jgi:hypothetical protein
MFRTVTTTFHGIKGRAAYTCPCDTCGKTLKRTAVVEHTVNPYNKNEDGSVRTPVEVRRRAFEAAEAEAKQLQDKPVTCSNCADAPMRDLLLAMASQPDVLVQPPERYFNSPLHVLVDRKNVEEVYERQGDDWKRLGYRITAKGLKRAGQLQKAA